MLDRELLKGVLKAVDADNHRLENLAEMRHWSGQWRRVFICAAFSPENGRTREKIWNYCRFAIEHKCIPVAPDYYYPEFMIVWSDQEQSDMRRFALLDMLSCAEVWVFGDDMTPEMEFRLRFAELRGINIRWFPDWDKALKEYCEEADDFE